MSIKNKGKYVFLLPFYISHLPQKYKQKQEKTRSKSESFVKINIWNPMFKTPNNSYKNATKSNKKLINLST